MFDDEEIEILDFEEKEKKQTRYKPLIAKERIKHTQVEFEKNSNQKITINNHNQEKNDRNKIIVVKKRNEKRINDTNKSKKINIGYIMIIVVIIISLILMINMILNIENKHNKKEADNKEKTEAKIKKKNSIEKITICKLDENNQAINVSTEKTIRINHQDNRVKEITITETQKYITQDSEYLKKQALCNSMAEQSDAYEGYSLICNIDDYNNIISTITHYKLKKINNNNLQNINPPLLLDSDINDAIQNYKNMNYICD